MRYLSMIHVRELPPVRIFLYRYICNFFIVDSLASLQLAKLYISHIFQQKNTCDNFRIRDSYVMHIQVCATESRYIYKIKINTNWPCHLVGCIGD